MNGRGARGVTGLLLAVASTVAAAAPARAGGAWLYPVHDRYDAGDVAMLVGYVSPGGLGWLDDGPFYAYLLEGGAAPPIPSDRGVPLGPLTIEETGASGGTALRVSLAVALTRDVAPGRYQVGYCNDPCLTGLGDLIGSRPFSIGVDPVEALVREWPLDEPEIANLDAGSLVAGPGYLATAAEIRAGRVTSAAPGPAPSPAPAPPAAVGPVPTAPTVLPAATPPLPTPLTPPAVRTSSDDGSPWLLLLGIGIAAVCTGGVLRALRHEGAAPTNPFAARPA